MLSLRVLPRPSLLTGAVVTVSVVTGLTVGALAGGLVVLVASTQRRT